MTTLIICPCCERSLPFGRFNHESLICVDCDYDRQAEENYGIKHATCRWKGINPGRQCAEYNPVYEPTPNRDSAGVCFWYKFHKRPCHAFIPTFFCLNGYNDEFKSKKKRTRKVKVVARRYINGNLVDRAGNRIAK